MRVVLKDYSGIEWYVNSEQHISVKACPQCGKPMEVSILSLEPLPVSVVTFRNSEGKILGLFDTDAFPIIPMVCHFCGFEKKR